MSNLTRTTITIPDDLLQQTKMYAVTHRTTVSKLIHVGLERQINTPQTNPQDRAALLIKQLKTWRKKNKQAISNIDGTKTIRQARDSRWNMS